MVDCNVCSNNRLSVSRENMRHLVQFRLLVCLVFYRKDPRHCSTVLWLQLALNHFSRFSPATPSPTYLSYLSFLRYLAYLRCLVYLRWLGLLKVLNLLKVLALLELLGLLVEVLGLLEMLSLL